MRNILTIPFAIIAALMLGGQQTLAGEFNDNPMQRWSGTYAGVFLGKHDISTKGIFDAVELGVLPVLDKIGDKGVHTGLYAGHLWQSGVLLFGFEFDYSPGRFERSFDTVQDGSVSEAGLLTYPISGRLDYLVTARARAGFAFTGPFEIDMMVFATGGAVFTSFTMDIADGRSEVSFTDRGNDNSFRDNRSSHAGRAANARR